MKVARPDYSNIVKETRDGLRYYRSTSIYAYPKEWIRLLLADHTRQVRELKTISKIGR